MKVYVLIKEVPQTDFRCGGLAAVPARRILNIYESALDAWEAYNTAMIRDEQDVTDLDCDPCDFLVQAWDVVVNGDCEVD